MFSTPDVYSELQTLSGYGIYFWHATIHVLTAILLTVPWISASSIRQSSYFFDTQRRALQLPFLGSDPFRMKVPNRMWPMSNSWIKQRPMPTEDWRRAAEVGITMICPSKCIYRHKIPRDPEHYHDCLRFVILARNPLVP